MPTWFVTARHGRKLLVDGEIAWTPYGVSHARRVGDSWTACGEPALGWELFWEKPFASTTRAACRGCLEAVGARPRSAWSRR